MELLKSALAAGLVLGILDVLWLGFIARNWLFQQLGPLMRDKVLVVPSVAFYVIYCGGLGFFAVSPALLHSDWLQAALGGACLGLVTYGTYDLTNFATLRNWPVAMVFVDLLWGTAHSAAAAAGGVLLLKQLGWA